ncbi:UNVERIFIED_CONTAM: hypothetical protein Slati_3634100 [Sesamum latifolium]|uniref:Uncharacterized protein n=1 Tax=Sesamum latifolium TaxID=2727402 RepID=A0AAW2U0V4_9LAMI
MALKASGAYRHCAPCANQPAPQPRRNGSFGGGGGGESDSVAPEKFRWSYRRTGSSNSSSTAGRRELEARLKGISSGRGRRRRSGRNRAGRLRRGERAQGVGGSGGARCVNYLCVLATWRQ